MGRPKGENLLHFSECKWEVRIPEEDSKGCCTSFSSFFKLKDHELICEFSVVIIMTQINVACLKDED